MDKLRTKIQLVVLSSLISLMGASAQVNSVATVIEPSAAAKAKLQHNTDSVLKAYHCKIVKAVTSDSDVLVYQTDEKPKPTIVYLCSSNFFPFVVNSEFVAFPFNLKVLGDRYNLVMLQKPGIPIGSDSINNNYINETIEDGYYLSNNEKMPTEFVANNYCDFYVGQYTLLIDWLKQQPWVVKEAIYLIGHGQGAEIAPKIADKQPDIKKVALLSPGSLYNRFCEAIREIRLEETYHLVPAEDAQKRIDSLYTNFSDLVANKNNRNELFDAFSYASFYSFSFPPMKDKILGMKQKTLLVYGTHSIQDLDLDYLKLDLIASGKGNIDVFPYPGLDHNFLENTQNEKGETIGSIFYWDKVIADILTWLDKP